MKTLQLLIKKEVPLKVVNTNTSMHLKTVQASAFKAVFEVLKDIINDVNVYFTDTGIRILTIDTAHVTLVHMNLAAENFEEYNCPTTIIAGMNMSNMFKLLKSVSSQDTLTIDIEGRDYMNIKIENSVKKSFTSFKLKLLDINEDELEVPDIDMDVITTLPSIDFQKIARDMGNLSNEITIIRDRNILEFSCLGDFADQITKIECPESVKRIGNTYSLKYIGMYTRATGMCSSVQIMQNSSRTDIPIIFRYSIANLGDLKFYLAAKVDE
jgi:proliferating cell nuclear antigen